MRLILICSFAASLFAQQLTPYLPINFGGWVDPTISYHASGSIVTTTGTIGSGTSNLIVGSPVSWEAGMGIAIPSAGAAGATLVTTVSAISGTTFTLATTASTTATGVTVQHDDTVAINASLALCKVTHLPTGSYNITGTLTIGCPEWFIGDGNFSTTIYNRSTTANAIVVNYQANAVTHPPQGARLADFTIMPGSGITPTAGYGISVASASGAGFYVENLVIDRVGIWKTCGGISIGTGVYVGWYNDLRISDLVGCGAGFDGIYINSPAPSGDNHFHDVELAGNNTGVTIVAADTQEFSNLKTNFTGITINPTSDHAVGRVRFINPSIEGNSVPGSIGVFMTSHIADQISFDNANIGIWDQGVSASFCHDCTFHGGTVYDINNNNCALAFGGGNGTVTGMSLAPAFAGTIDTVAVCLVSGADYSIVGNTIDAGTKTLGHPDKFVFTDSSVPYVRGLSTNNNPGNLTNNLNAVTIPDGGVYTPSSSTQRCDPPMFFYDSLFDYTCTSTNTIRRVLTSTF